MMQATTFQFQQSTASYPTDTPHPVSQSRPTPQPAQDNTPSVPGTSNPLYVPTTPGPSRFQQAQGGSDSDTDFQPRFSAAEKGKHSVAVASWISMSDEEAEEPPLEEAMRESATPTPNSAQVNGLLRSIDALQFTTLPGS
jgi:hypothetical protein